MSNSNSGISTIFFNITLDSSSDSSESTQLKVSAVSHDFESELSKIITVQEVTFTKAYSKDLINSEFTLKTQENITREHRRLIPVKSLEILEKYGIPKEQILIKFNLYKFTN